MDNSPSSFDRRRFSELLAAKCNDALTEEQAVELEAMVLASPEFGKEYWAAVALHTDLERELSSRGNWSGRQQPASAGAANLEIEKAPLSELVKSTQGLVLAACLLIAATVGIAALWRHGATPHENSHLAAGALPAVTPVLAQVTPLQPNSRWSFGRAGGWNSTDFRQGDTITLDEGGLRLEFPSATSAVLNAPLVMQVLAADRIRVHRGQIKVEVAEGAGRFSVETASAEVVDLGTVFSVDAGESGTDVVVLDGEVDVKHLTASLDAGEIGFADTARRLQAGEAVHVSRDGTLSRIVNVNHLGFANISASGSGALIKAVRDNIVRDDMLSFYEIVPNGIKEDAKCYVDRGHEWNGADAAGIPPYLLGADYVKTFCDDKVTPHLSIELELQAPAVVYILLDRRLEAPAWLLERFENTGDEIGIDEVDSGGHKLGVGPGMYIERTFSIWKMVAEEGGVVQLGPNGDTSPAQRARGVNAESVMYGIAAKRLPPSNEPAGSGPSL